VEGAGVVDEVVVAGREERERITERFLAR